jgi:hypothetical protein
VVLSSAVSRPDTSVPEKEEFGRIPGGYPKLFHSREPRAIRFLMAAIPLKAALASRKLASTVFVLVPFLLYHAALRSSSS